MMKIETTVKGVEMIGEEMHLKLQGWPTTAPDGAMAQDYSLPVPATAKAKRAFYIGRKVHLTVEPL